MPLINTQTIIWKCDVCGKELVIAKDVTVNQDMMFPFLRVSARPPPGWTRVLGFNKVVLMGCQEDQNAPGTKECFCEDCKPSIHLDKKGDASG